MAKMPFCMGMETVEGYEMWALAEVLGTWKADDDPAEDGSRALTPEEFHQQSIARLEERMRVAREQGEHVPEIIEGYPDVPARADRR